MKTYKTTLKDFEGNELFPKTISSEIVLPDGITILDDVLTQINSTLEEVNIDYTASNGVVLSSNDFSLNPTFKPTFNGAIFTNPVKVYGLNVTDFTPFPYSMISGRCDRDGYTQYSIQNFNNGANASADLVLYNDLSDNEEFLLDLGLNSSNYSSEDYPLFTSNSAYIYTGSNGEVETPSDLFIGTSSTNSDIVFFSGGFEENHEVMRISSNGSVTINDLEGVDQEFTVSGGAQFNGDVDFAGVVTLAADPSLPLEAATKQYVDNVAQGISIKQGVDAGTTDTLINLVQGSSPVITYDNGTDGVDATLTLSGTYTYDFLDSEVWDGYTSAAIGVRVLVKNQANAAHNGIYEITSATVLTRTSDFNSDPTIEAGSFVFISDGTLLHSTSWVQTSTVNDVGIDNIEWAQFGSGSNYLAGSNILIDGNVISLSGTVPVTKGGIGLSSIVTGNLLYGSGSNTLSALQLGPSYKSLVVNGSGTQLEWNAVALNQSNAVSGQLGVSNGGTGASTAQGALDNLGASSKGFAVAMAIALS